MGSKSNKTLNCKFCNKDFIIIYEHTQSGFSSCNKKYCSIECKSAKRKEKSDSSITLKCTFCERDYTQPPSLAKNSRYCSRSCQNRFFAKQNIKERVVRTCDTCQNNFEVIFGSKRKYCSLACSNVGQRSERVSVPCETCGKNFEKYVTSVKRFCNRKCQYAAQSSGKIKMYSRGRSGVRSDLGVYFRSSLEADYARYCRHIDLEYQYEPKTFTISLSDSEQSSYTPDFFHPSTQEFIELKAGRKDHAFEKNLRALEALKKDGLNIRIVYMKDFYDSLKTKELFNVIPKLEFRNYKGTKHLVINS